MPAWRPAALWGPGWKELAQWAGNNRRLLKGASASRPCCLHRWLPPCFWWPWPCPLGAGKPGRAAGFPGQGRCAGQARGCEDLLRLQRGYSASSPGVSAERRWPVAPPRAGWRSSPPVRRWEPSPFLLLENTASSSDLCKAPHPPPRCRLGSSPGHPRGITIINKPPRPEPAPPGHAGVISGCGSSGKLHSS